MNMRLIVENKVAHFMARYEKLPITHNEEMIITCTNTVSIFNH